MLNPDEYGDLLNRMQALDDASLLRIVLLGRDEYKPEAVEIAEGEVRRRKLQSVTPDAFASRFPNEYYRYAPIFCPKCLEETIDEAAGSTIDLGAIGVSLFGHKSECDVCGSIIREKWIRLIIPIFPIGKYRMKYLEDPGMERGKHISRKLKPTN